MANIRAYRLDLVMMLLCWALSGCQVADQPDQPVVDRQEQLRTVIPLDVKALAPAVSSDNPNAVASAAPAPTTFMLTLAQCRAAALRNNLDLKVELLSPAIAAATLSEEEAKFESVFTSGFNFAKVDAPTDSTLNSTQEETAQWDLALEAPLRTGGTVGLELTSDRTRTDNLFSTLNPSYTRGLSASISQPLLRDAGVRANTHSIRIARYQQQITEARAKLELIRVIAAVDRMYWLLYDAHRQLEIRRNEHHLAEEQLDRARRRVDAGASPEVEIIRAEAGLAARSEEIIIADNHLRQAQRQLKLALNKPGLGSATPTVLICATAPVPLHYQVDPDLALQVALENRMEMLELELQIAQDVSTIDFQRNQLLPLLALEYRYNIDGLGASDSDALEMLYDKDFESHAVGLQLSVPLGNQAARSRLRRAMLIRTQRLATRQRRQTRIDLEVAAAIDQFETAWQRVLAGRQRQILAERELQAEQRQFELGLITSVDVLDTQRRFGQAQSAHSTALADYQIAQVDLAYATGTILGAAKIQWQPADPPGKLP